MADAEYPGLFASFTRPMQEGDGAYRTTGVFLKIAGWLRFVGFVLTIIIGVIAVIGAFAAGQFAADFAGEVGDCDADCQEFIEDFGWLAGLLMLVFFAIVWLIQYVILRLVANANYRWADQSRGALGSTLTVGILFVVLSLFPLGALFAIGNMPWFYGSFLTLAFGILFIIMSSLPEVRAHFPEGQASN